MSTACTTAHTTPRTAPRLRQICLATPTLAPWVGQLQQLFGLGAACDDPHVAKYGLVNAALAVGRQFIELVAPVQADAPLHRFLARHPGGAAALGLPVVGGCLALAGMRLRLSL